MIRYASSLYVLSLLLIAPAASAQMVPVSDGGARLLALGRAGTAVSGDVWGMSNPAAWAGMPGATASVFVARPFGLSELQTVAAAAAHPTPVGTIALLARSYGFEDFRETVLGVGFGRGIPISPTRELQAGIALRYTGVSIPDFGSSGAIGLSAGLIVELLPGMSFGAHALNLNRPQLSDFDPLESRLDAGLLYEAHPAARVLLAVSKDLDFPLSLRGGLEVQPVDILFARAGFTTEPTRFSAGAGFNLAMLRADVAFEHHQVLGWTPAVEVGLRW